MTRSEATEIAVAAFLALVLLVFVAGLCVGATSCPLFAATLPADAALSPTQHCFAWSTGSAPAGTTWYDDLVYVDLGADRATLQVTASTDAGAQRPYRDRYYDLEVGIVPGDAGATEIADLRAFLRRRGVHEVARGAYRCRVGAAGCPSAPLHPECEVWADRYADAGVPGICRCGSGCLVSTNGTTWTAAPAGEVLGPRASLHELVKPSGSGVCRAVPCGLLEGDEDALGGLCP